MPSGNWPWNSTTGASSLSYLCSGQVVCWEDRSGQCRGDGVALTHRPAGLQTLLFREEVVAIPHAAAIIEGLAGHGCAVIEIPLEQPQARTL